jgi:hypothetical protein
MEQDEALDPVNVALFGARGVVLALDRLAHRSAELTAKPGPAVSWDGSPCFTSVSRYAS